MTSPQSRRAMLGAALWTLAPIFGALVAATLALSTLARAEPARLVEDAPCHIDGLETPVRCVGIERPLDPAAPAGETIRIRAVIVPSVSATPKADPLVILAGGPGQGASGYGGFVALAFAEVRRARDIVLFDQRGTGRSTPLACDTAAMELTTDPAAIDAAIRACAAATPHDPRFFTLSHAIDDLDAMRFALGFDQVNLWGGSYGTRTAQQYVRRYGAHVRSLVLDGAVAPATRLFLTAPADARAALDALDADCRADAACARVFPGVRADVEAVLAALESAPVALTLPDPLSGRPLSVTVTRELLSEAIRSALYTPRRAALLPFAVARARTGDYAPLLAMQADMSAGLADSIQVGATMSVLCADEIAITSPSAASAAGIGFSRDAYFTFWATACASWPHGQSEPDFATPVAVDVPVLVLSGGLDPVTPPARGDEAAAQFPRAWHFVAPKAGHNVSSLGCASRLIAGFIDATSGDHLDPSCLEKIKRPPFVLTATGSEG